jgi:hypothetical protein
MCAENARNGGKFILSSVGVRRKGCSANTALRIALRNSRNNAALKGGGIAAHMMKLSQTAGTGSSISLYFTAKLARGTVK